MAADTKCGVVQWISVGTGDDYFMDVSVGEVERQLARLGLHVVTAADRAVLDAVAAASDDIVRLWVAAPAGLVGFYHDLGVAELARRGLKP